MFYYGKEENSLCKQVVFAALRTATNILENTSASKILKISTRASDS